MQLDSAVNINRIALCTQEWQPRANYRRPSGQAFATLSEMKMRICDVTG